MRNFAACEQFRQQQSHNESIVLIIAGNVIDQGPELILQFPIELEIVRFLMLEILEKNQNQ